MQRRRGALRESDPGLWRAGRPACAEQGARGCSHVISKRYGRGQDGGVHRGRGEQLQQGENLGCEDPEEIGDEARKPALGGAGGEHADTPG